MANPSLSYSAGPFVASNPTSNAAGGNCPDDTVSCHHYALTVDFTNVPANATVTITTSWNTPGGSDDIDVYLLKSPGNAVIGSAASSSNPEIIFLPISAFSGTQFRIRQVPFLVAGTSTTTTIRLSTVEEGDPCLSPTSAQASSSARGVVLSPGLARDLVNLSPSAPYAAFIKFAYGTPAQHRKLLEAAGLKVAYDFERYASTLFATGPAKSFIALMADPMVRFMEENKQLEFFNDTNGWSTRVRVAQESVSGGPYKDALNRPLMGEGVTVAIMDTGLNATHGDFAGRVKHNWKISGDPIGGNFVYQDVQYGDTDLTSGHGTHVAGTVGGSGLQSKGEYPVAGAAPNVQGTFAGAAPNVNLIMYSVGETPDPVGTGAVPSLLLYITAALQHLANNFDGITPRVRAVSLSLGDGPGSVYNPISANACIVKALVAKGANVVWAAGNSGPGPGAAGSTDRTSSFCKDPTPGVLCVAAYDDSATGTIKGSLSTFSSRGKSDTASSYPDITAPGTNVTSTCLQGAPGQVTCSSGAETRWQPWYGTISGTSMATPHVSGAIALIAQAKPELTPAQIEKLIQDTARKVSTNGAYVADPQNPGGTHNFGFGAGLLNVPAALKSAGVPSAGLPVAGIALTVIDGDADSSAAGAADVVKLVLQETPAGTSPRGIVYRVTVRDATDFARHSAGIRYRVAHNVDGNHYEVEVVATAAAVANGGGTATATNVSRSGNVISFTVPYSALGTPPIAAPVHNVRMFAIDHASGEMLDVAPSAITGGSATAVAQPMWGKNFTVQQQVQAPLASFESTCVAPGVTLFTDQLGDDNPQSPTAAGGAGDIVSLQVSEPANDPTKIIFTLKMRSLTTIPPNVNWFVIFNGPAKGTNTTGKWHAEMRSNETSTVSFQYGRYNPANQNLSQTAAAADGDEVSATAMQGSSYDAAAGVITLKINKSNFGPIAPATETNLLNISSTIYQLVGANGTGSLQTIDQGGGSATYSYRAANLCANNPPVANLSVNQASGTAPLTVDFTVNATDTDGDAVRKYGIDFGDETNSGIVTVASLPVTVSHQYAVPGVYPARLIVQDVRGAASTNLAQQNITVTANSPPTANAGADFAIDEGAAAMLSAALSSDPDAGDSLSYAWSQASGPIVVLSDNTAATPSFVAPQVEADTALSFTLTVTDNSGASDTDSVTVTIRNVAQQTLDSFSFIERTGVAQDSFITSEVKAMTGGFSTALPVSMTNGGQFSINGGAYSTSGSILNGQTLRVRHVSSSAPGAEKISVVTVGTLDVPFKTVTTSVDRVPDAFTFGTKLGQDAGTPVTSDPAQLTGYNTDVSIQPGPGIAYSLDGGSTWLTTAGLLAAPDGSGMSVPIVVRHTAHSSSLGYTKTYLKIGGVVGYFTTRTK